MVVNRVYGAQKWPYSRWANGMKFHPTYRGEITPLITGFCAHLVCFSRTIRPPLEAAGANVSGSHQRGPRDTPVPRHDGTGSPGFYVDPDTTRLEAIAEEKVGMGVGCLEDHPGL